MLAADASAAILTLPRVPGSARLRKPSDALRARALQRDRGAVKPSRRANFDFRTD
jgi:hypothetical protein